MKSFVKYLVLVAAIVMIIAGIMNGEAQIVLQKATKICLECIGVG